MDTNKIKKFATEARTILKAGIAAKIVTLGFDKNGNVSEENRPQLMQGGSLWNGQVMTEGFYHQWMSLYNRIQKKGVNEVYEEAAYTWFNRLCAIRILQKNNLCEPVLVYADAARTPIIVDNARQGHLPQMKEDIRQRLIELLDDDMKVTEQFAVLITAWCHANPIINKCFGSITDYTELLLPNNILAEGGFVDMLNHTEFITDENFRSPELIGWLYQFYISERKDEVFSKKGKFEADEIPAATQIFTPNWIVKYMVQNTVGRIYLDNNPYETQLQKNWKYLVEPSEKASEDTILKYEELTDLKVADLACGSGHILNECFDLLYDLYIAEGYGRGEAIENIFVNNLTGIDLDSRAKQLATFALILKACQKDASFADAHILPNVLTMPKPWDEDKDGDIKEAFHQYFQGEETNIAVDELSECFELIKDADSLGSIMKFNINESTRLLVKQTTDYWCKQEFVSGVIVLLVASFKLILALTEKYHTIVLNPPYMGSGNMNETLSKYVKENYSKGRSDLATVFVDLMPQKCVKKGKYAFIIPPSWMFLTAFEALRQSIIKYNKIESLLHLSRGVFGADFGASTCVVSNTIAPDSRGIYFRLVQRTFQEFNQEHLKQLFDEVLDNHSFKFDFSSYTKDNPRICHSEKGSKIYYADVMQKNFTLIPGSPLAYWVTSSILSAFSENNVSSYYVVRNGISTGDNTRYLRLWHEVAHTSEYWKPCNKGGQFRRWYGNNEYVVFWKNDGHSIRTTLDDKGRIKARLGGIEYSFQQGLEMSRIVCGKSAFRYSPEGFIYESSTNDIYPKDGCPNLFFALGYFNTNIVQDLINLMNPTINVMPDDIRELPFIKDNQKENIVKDLVLKNIYISKQDWDAHETSWDFLSNELIRVAENQTGLIDDFINRYRTEWENNFDTLHENEEELNRQFIDTYGLQNELTPEVSLSEITILQAGEITHITDESENGGSHYEWNYDNLIKQLISYAVGCMLGRYRLDKSGLHIAHPDPTEEEIAAYPYHGEMYEIDDDGIMPLMSNDCGFSDNASFRFSDFIRQVFGDEYHVANLNYIEEQLGKTVEQYFVKDFWKDHKKMYQNRPIYWMFASKKGAFQVIAYMHRMNAYTVERVRAKYLLPYIEHLQEEINKLEMRRAELSTKETKQLQNLQKQLDECREYHERLQVVAEQAISFDLDDGVVVNYAKFGDVLQKIK